MVVEHDDISTQIIRHLNARKGGRVTFIPLNRVKAPQVSYPQNSDVIPLLKKLKFSRDHAPAFAQVSSAEVLSQSVCDFLVSTSVKMTRSGSDLGIYAWIICFHVGKVDLTSRFFAYSIN